MENIAFKVFAGIIPLKLSSALGIRMHENQAGSLPEQTGIDHISMRHMLGQRNDGEVN